jgi:hypothetical protein
VISVDESAAESVIVAPGAERDLVGQRRLDRDLTGWASVVPKRDGTTHLQEFIVVTSHRL